MKNRIFSILLCLLLVSCEHKELCYSHPHDKEARVVFDWSDIKEENIPNIVMAVFRNSTTNLVSEFALPPEGGTVMIPNGTYEFTAYNVGQHENIIVETPTGRVATTPISRLFEDKCYKTPNFLCLKNKTIVLTDSEESRVITAKPSRRTAIVSYEINGINQIGSVKAIYAEISGCSGELELYTGRCVDTPSSIIFEVDPIKHHGWFYMFGCGFSPENKTSDKHTHIISIYLVHKDNKYTKIDADITEQMLCDNPVGEPVKDFHIVVDLNIQHPYNEDTNSFFNPDVEDWENIEIDILL